MADLSRAGWLVLCACFLATLPRAEAPLAACRDPASLGSGPTRVVVCGEPEGQPLEGSIRRLFDLPIDVNRADARSLASLPGIGPARARAIIDGRPYGAPEDLRRVPGVGPKLLEGLRHLITTESRAREEPIASGVTTRR